MKKYLLISILFLCWAKVEAQPLKPFQKGERVAFVGNSITDGGHYHSYIWLYYMTRFPNDRITIMNAGIGGDIAEQMLNRFDDDVLSKKPSTITLTFGMNDVGYYDFYKPNAAQLAEEKIQKSYNDYLKIEKKLQALPNVKKIIIAGSPYDETAKFKKEVFPGKSNAMLKIVDFQKKSADANHWGYVDFNTPMTEINKREQKTDTAFTLCGGDRIHPGNDGHFVMACVFLKAQGLAGKKVSDVCIDASKNSIVQSENCKISKLGVSGNELVFNYLANSLPYPVDTIPRGWNEVRKQSDALKLIPFQSEFNQELLTVKGLEAGDYQLTIDNEKVGVFSSNLFNEGINLALYINTPQYQQALQVMVLNEERWEIERRLRQYAWMQFTFFREKGLLFADNQTAIDTLNANLAKNIFLGWNKENYSKSRYKAIREVWQLEMDLLIDQIYILNKPVSRKIRISKVLK